MATVALPCLSANQPWFEVNADNGYQTRFILTSDASDTTHAPTDDQAALQRLLQAHLSIHEVMHNPRLNDNEWRRLVHKTPQEIADLLATEGYFKTNTSIVQHQPQLAEFHVHLPLQARVAQVNASITGDIQQPAYQASLEAAQKSWPLPVNSVFTQQAWSTAKREILASLLKAEFPNARITTSQAMVNPQSQTVLITLAVDSGPAVRIGQVHIKGLQHYRASLLPPLITLKSGAPYRQADLLTLQNSFMSTGKFRSVDVRANTEHLNADHTADVEVSVNELEQNSVRIGVGASTNTGARVVFNYTDRNLFDRGLLWDSSLRLEQRLQAATSNITFLTDSKGYRDSIQNSITRTDL